MEDGPTNSTSSSCFLNVAGQIFPPHAARLFSIAEIGPWAGARTDFAGTDYKGRSIYMWWKADWVMTPDGFRIHERLHEYQLRCTVHGAC